MATARKDFDPATFDPTADLLPLLSDLELLALVGIVAPPRPTAKASIAVNGLFDGAGSFRSICGAAGAVREVASGIASINASRARRASESRLSPTMAAAASAGSFVT